MGGVWRFIPFPRIISPKVNIIARLEFELVSFEIAFFYISSSDFSQHCPHSPKLQHYWKLTIRLFSVICRTLVWRGSYPSAKVQLVYSTSPANWAKRKSYPFVKMQSMYSKAPINWIIYLDFWDEAWCAIFCLWFFGLLPSSLLLLVVTQRFGCFILRPSAGVSCLSGHEKYSTREIILKFWLLIKLDPNCAKGEEKVSPSRRHG